MAYARRQDHPIMLISSYEDARQKLNYRFHNKFNNLTTKQWHHIWEESMGGIHNFRNLAIVATKSHEKITATYTNTDDQYGREFKNLRQYLASKSPAYQWTKGKEVIQDLGYTITTQDKGRGKYQEIN